MTTPYELDQDLSLSTVMLSLTRSPGVVVLARHDRPKRWTVKSAKGKTGASMTLEGDDPADFDATFYLSEPDHFTQWEGFQKLIEATTSTPKPFALPIYHPDLARNRITEVTNGGVGGMIHDGKGGATVKVTFKEYKPPKKKSSASPTAKGSAPGGAAATKPDPNAAAKAELAALLAKAQGP
jgi:hypothetical protein